MKKFELPISMSIGASINQREGNLTPGLYSDIKVGISYFVTQNWAIGLRGGISIIPILSNHDLLKIDNGIISYSNIEMMLTYRR